MGSQLHVREQGVLPWLGRPIELPIHLAEQSPLLPPSRTCKHTNHASRGNPIRSRSTSQEATIFLSRVRPRGVENWVPQSCSRAKAQSNFSRPALGRQSISCPANGR